MAWPRFPKVKDLQIVKNILKIRLIGSLKEGNTYAGLTKLAGERQ